MQLIVAVVGSMGDFLVLFSLAIVGFALAFMLVFSEDGAAAAYSNSTNASTIAATPATDDSKPSFGNLPVSLFRSFATMLGDFDWEEIWEGGPFVLVVFLVAMVIGNIAPLWAAPITLSVGCRSMSIANSHGRSQETETL